MSEENEASSSKELVNRRTALQTLGLGAISSGISTLAAGSRKPEEEVRYPKLISGDEVVEYITVPKRWDEHRKQAQKVLDKIRAGLHNIPAVEETQLEASSESFGGVSGKKIVVLVNDVNADGIQNIPSKEGGIPIEVREMPRRQQGSKNCSDETSDDNCGNDEATSSVPGGYSFGEENKNKGSSCCEVIYNGKDRMLTVAHLFGDHCSNPENIVGTKASAGGTTVGKVTEFNQDEDWAIVDKSEGGSYLNYIQESSDTPTVTGYVGYLTLDYWASNQTDSPCLENMGRATGHTTGKIQATDVSSTLTCTDYNDNGVKTYCNFAEGDSGSPTYYTNDDGDAYIISTTGYGYNWIGTLYCNNETLQQFGNSGGTAAYHLANSHDLKFGSNSSI